MTEKEMRERIADLTKQLDAAKKNSDDLTAQLKTSGDTLAGLQVKLNAETSQVSDLTKSNTDLKPHEWGKLKAEFTDSIPM